MKRLFDMSVSGAAMLVCAPLLIALTALVRLTSKGPALFWSERVGRDGRTFWMPKFRTMRTTASVIPREAMDKPDAHITPLGKLLRKSSLDELPQLWSVLIGDMSLVGPRPLLVIDPAIRARKAMGYGDTIRPGITGLAQINGRNTVSPRRKARYDKFYAKRQSTRLDVSILRETIRAVISARGVL